MLGARLAGAVLLTFLAARVAPGQCPDGSPPPCSSARPAAVAPVRHADPPLDDHTWIVVPFNNVTRAADVDYLRDASVNLLYLDLSKWSDIHVVDDARVTDLLRQVPEARTSPLSLDAATAMARRAGAGRLVMGNFIKQGSRTTLAAKVFDVRRGTVIRSPQQDLVVQDSLMAVFGRLAGGILGVAPPPGIEVADIGTSSVGAYQEYLAGVIALKRFDLETAQPHLEQALKLDSTFALAHYSLSTVFGWALGSNARAASHAAAAARLSGALPPRERALMKAKNEFEQGQFGQSCATYGSLIKTDSTDVEALYGLGECSYHDNVVVRVASDTSRRMFETSWNTAIRAFERVLELDPTYHLAFQHILDALTTDIRRGSDLSLCSPTENTTTTCVVMLWPVMPDGDSLSITPVSSRDTARLRIARLEYARTDARGRNLRRARDKASAWVASAPDESRAHLELGHIHALLGDWGNAAKEFAQVKGKLTDTELSKFIPDRIEMGLKTAHAAEARRLTDSAIAVIPAASQARIFAAVLVGQLGRLDSAMRAGTPRTLPPVIFEYQGASARVFVTGGSARADSVERRYLDTMVTTPRWAARRAASVPSILYSPARARAWPTFEYPADDRRSAALTAISKGDTARLRLETLALDSVLRAQPTSVPDSGGGLIVAELYLTLRDSAAALRTMRRMLDTTLARTPAWSSVTVVVVMPVLTLWPRLALLRADLEAAVGDRRAARTWYQQFIDLWSGADPELKPLVERARKSLAALGGGSG